MKQEKEQWIIFFDDNSVRYYYEKINETINRVKFSKDRFCVFESVLDVNEVLKKIENILKYTNPIGNIHLDASKIKLKAAKVIIN